MLKVEQTSRIEEQMKKYKRLFEDPHLNTYFYLHEEKYYQLVRFFRFGKVKGVLILDKQGEPVSRLLAQMIYKQMNSYNAIASGAVTEIQRKMLEPIQLVEEPLQWMEYIEKQESVKGIEPQWNALKDMFRQLIKGRLYIKEIFEQLLANDDLVYDKQGYLSEEQVKKANSLLNEYNYTMYTEGKIQLDSFDDAAVVKEFLKGMSGTAADKAQMLQRSLTELTNAAARKRLENSMLTFEKDEYGKSMTQKRGALTLEQLEERAKRISDYEYEQQFLTMIRNH
ncbi:hypothetical protein [Priestia abyssalis]|uniref:hypothetical protein n=1 Tax=Priestia abyssalis TaxID=1221450 RepID=UPI000995CC2E|nr:hypothetical protein [Priestia abyssalis]